MVDCGVVGSSGRTALCRPCVVVNAQGMGQRPPVTGATTERTPVVLGGRAYWVTVGASVIR